VTDFFVEIFFKTKRIVFHGWLEKVMGTIKETSSRTVTSAWNREVGIHEEAKHACPYSQAANLAWK
jgi:hypothetical protein